MKKLKKLETNKGKLIKNDELLTLRGGYGDVACSCKKSTTTLCSQWVDNCYDGYGSCEQWCNYYCPDYEYAICAGW